MKTVSILWTRKYCGACQGEVRRYEGVKGEKDRVTQLQMMRIKMETKIQTFLR